MSDSTGPDVELLRSGYEAFAVGDMAAVDALFADDVVWHVAGRGPMAGDFTGKEQVFGHLGQFLERSGGTYKIEPHDFLASDGHGVVLSTGTASRQGRQLNVRFLDIYHVTDSRVVEWWSSSPDQYDNDEFWGDRSRKAPTRTASRAERFTSAKRRQGDDHELRPGHRCRGRGHAALPEGHGRGGSRAGEGARRPRDRTDSRITIWTSRADQERFVTERLHPAFATLPAGGRPAMTGLDVENLVIGPAVR